MARKPNYHFDRMERDRAKAAKRMERQKAKQEKAAPSPETPVPATENSEPDD